ncbi:Unknown protein sequence [Pseudomonas syringae pv. syringae]|nr:Unknown protein sequence [Pseudomonas syringae pv. syringae]
MVIALIPRGDGRAEKMHCRSGLHPQQVTVVSAYAVSDQKG